MSSLSTILKSAAAAATLASPLIAGSPNRDFPSIVPAFNTDNFPVSASLTPFTGTSTTISFNTDPVRKRNLPRPDVGATNATPFIDLGVNAARFSAMYGSKYGSVIPMEPFFLHSSAKNNSNMQRSRADFGVMAGGLTISLGLSGQVEEGQPLNIRQSKSSSISLPTTDIKTSTVVSISHAWSVGEHWSVFGKDVREGLFAIGASADVSSMEAQTATFGGNDYLTKAPQRKSFGSASVSIGLQLRF